MILDELIDEVVDDFESAFAEGGPRVELQDAQASIQDLRQMLKNDAEFFIEFFLAEQLDLPVPEFHKEVWGLLTDADKERILLAIPRDHAKTTLAKLVVVWYWLFTSHRFCVYLSNTNAIAKGACKDIIGFLENPNFVAVYGKINMIKSSDTESLWMFDMPMGTGKMKRCILRAIGQGQQMRGINIDNQRPDIAIVDDVEDNENTESENLQKKLDRWIFGPFIKALARKKKILWLGNMLQKTSLLARLSRNQRWNPVVFGSLVKDISTGQLRPLWPGKWTIEALIEDFQEYRGLGLIETWMCEMMNMPGHGENGFTQTQINYQPVPTPDNIRAAWITIDPAFGEMAIHDSTAICVHVLPVDGPPMVVSHIHAQMREHEMFNETLALATYWGAWVWGIEAIAAQKVLITLFQVLLASHQMSHSVEMIPLMAGKGDPKVARISAWVSLMQQGEYAIPDDDVEITTQLLSYNLKKKSQKDDLIDSCAYGPQMLDMYMPLILAQYAGVDFESSIAQYGLEIASV